VDLAGNAYESVQGTGIKEAPTAGHSSVIFNAGADAYGLAVDGARNVYAAVPSSASVIEWNPIAQQTTTLIGSGLSKPQGVAVDEGGNVYVADAGSNVVYELPYAFVPTTGITEQPAAGQDQLLPVLPATAPVTTTSDSSWLAIGTISNGVLAFTFTANTGATARTAHINVLGQSISVTQLGG